VLSGLVMKAATLCLKEIVDEMEARMHLRGGVLEEVENKVFSK
jgi:hypothetical protein